jgi:transcriptional regulator with XRE-family HTH domain
LYSRYAALRDKKGVTDYRVAKDLGFSRATLTGWKNGSYKPKVDKLLMLANYFGVSLEDLVGDGKEDG